MGVMRKIIIVMGVILLTSPLAYAGDVYISQNGGAAACGADGQKTTQSVSWFNSKATGGNTYHLCGTFTGTANSTMLTVPASGSSGNPLVVSFESNAVLTAPNWSSKGAIYLNGKSYVTVNGNNQGTITQTTPTDNSVGVGITSCSNITVGGLTITNLAKGDGTDSNSADVRVTGSNNTIRVTNNVLKNAHSGVQVEYSGNTDNGIEIDHNTIANHCWGISVGAGDPGSHMNNCRIHNNDISDWSGWPSPYHDDGIIVYGSVNVPVTFYVYNNYIHGNLGPGPTAFIYITTDGKSASSSTGYVYNNLLVMTGNESFCAPVWLGSYTYNNYVVNNTMIGPGPKSIPAVVVSGSSHGNTGNVIKNNIIESFASAVYNYSSKGSGITAWDYNDYYNLGSNFAVVNNGSFISYATWRGYGFDSHSISSTPDLNSSYIPNSGSKVIKAAANLASLGTTTLDSDKAGVARPSTGAWDIGAYQYPANTVSLTAPTGVHLLQ